jgi:MFS family permease
MSRSKRAAASGWIGSALEFYDFFIYATAASLVFPQLFFPSGNPTVAIVASLATYGAGYVARPIGAFFLGYWGDTHGRKTVLLVCIFLMGFSTMVVGVLPTYEQIGVLAPVFLVTLRLIQGFAVAGEISGASSMILEHAPFGRRGYYSSFTLQGVQAGQILAAAVFLPLAALSAEGGFQFLGLAHPVSPQLHRHRRGVSHSPQGRRNACLPRREPAARDAEVADHRRVQAQLG